MEYSLAEVSKHCSRDDCWVVVHGNVYDVSAFVPRHPGGSLIHVKAGGDCSQLFDSYHPLSTSRVLNKYRIGSLAPGEVIVHYEKQGVRDEFHVTLKQRVEAYFKANGLDPRVSPSMYAKTAIILAAVGGFSTLAFYVVSSYAVALMCAAAMGFAIAEVGVSVQHDANHGAYCKNRLLCYLAGATLDCVGASSFMWKQQHVVGHHAYTNVDGADPDICVKSDGSDIRCVAPSHPRGAHHAFQHMYLGGLYGLLAVRSIFYDDFAALVTGRIGTVKVAKFETHELLVFLAGKVLFASWFLALPAMYSRWNVCELFGLWTLGLLVTGWTLAFMFQVAHVVSDVAFPQMDAATGKIPGGWAEQQVATSADFSHGSWFWLHVSGGLNYQVVHHLFPGVVHTHYAALAPIVLEAAREYGIPYKVYPNFWSALRAHFDHVRILGNGAVPSLHTVG